MTRLAIPFTAIEKVSARFWLKVSASTSDQCWPWTGTTMHTGRGQVCVRVGSAKHRLTAPAVAWQLANRRVVPAGDVVRHRCDNPNCCNPSHLETGTQMQNLRDCVVRGRRNAFGRQKLQEPQVRSILSRADAGETHRSIASDYGIARHTVTGIVNGHSWKHITNEVTA